jgi:hypothetical protein
VVTRLGIDSLVAAFLGAQLPARMSNLHASVHLTSLSVANGGPSTSPERFDAAAAAMERSYHGSGGSGSRRFSGGTIVPHAYVITDGPG